MPISDIIGGVWEEMIPSNFTEAGGLTRQGVTSGIIRHYWMREIGVETVSLWRYMISTRLSEIMPKYLEMATAQESMGSIFDNAGFSEEREYGRNATEEEEGKETLSSEENLSISDSLVDNKKNVVTNDLTDLRTTTRTDALKEVVAGNNALTSKDVSSANGTTNGQNLYSDTPQNGLTNVKTGQYLTNATIDSQDSTETQTVDRTGTETNSSTKDNTGTLKTDDEVDRTGTVTSENSGGTTTTGKHDKVGSSSKDNMVTRGKKEDGNETITRKGFSGNKVQTMWDYSQMYVNIMAMIIGDVADMFMGVIG